MTTEILKQPKKKTKKQIKKKPKKISTERNKAMHYFQRARVLQEATDHGFVECWTCGKIDKVENMDGGHGIPRRHRPTELEPMNCHAQCRACNRMEGGQQHKYMEHIAEVFGQDEVDRLYDLHDAYYGSQEAMARLKQEDRAKVTQRRNARYYTEQSDYWKGIYESLTYKEHT